MPEATFVLEPEPITESEQVCELETASIIEKILVSIEGMDWSPTHTPVAERQSMNWVPKELLFDELDN